MIGKVTSAGSFGNDRVVDVKIGATLLLNQTYNKDDSVALKKYCNSNSSLTYTYNVRGFVSKILGRDSGNNIILNLNYNYTLDGDVANIKDTSGSAGNEYFWYDHLGRMTKAMANSTYGTIMYGYYPNGDRKWKSEGSNVTYTYGAYSMLSLNGTYSYRYDANGDLFWKNTTVGAVQLKHTFNSFGQLTRVDKYVSGAFNSNLGQYYYDANGARAKVTEGGASTTYIYAGHDPMYQVGADGKGWKYIYVGGSLELRVYTAAEKHAYLSDALGSTRKVLSNGQIGTTTFSAVTYKPFGIVVTTIGSDKLTYASEMRDQTGLFYLFARYYEPELGRFISLDPELGKTSQPQTLNRYVYCANNPLRFTDPTGRMMTQGLDGGGYNSGGVYEIAQSKTGTAAASAITEMQRQRLEWLNNGGREAMARDMTFWACLGFAFFAIFVFPEIVIAAGTVIASEIVATITITTVLYLISRYSQYLMTPNFLTTVANACSSIADLLNPDYTPLHIEGKGTWYPASGRGYFVPDTPTPHGPLLPPPYTPQHINGGTFYPASGRGLFVPD